MTRPLVLCLLALPCAAAADPPADPPITPANAAQLRPVRSVEKAPRRMVRGPAAGEVTLVDPAGGVEVVDDATLQTRRVVLKDRRPTSFAQTRDGARFAWAEGRGSTFTLEAAGGKPVELAVGTYGGGAAFSPDGKLLAIGHTAWSPAEEGAGESWVKVFDAAGRPVRTLGPTGPGHVTPVFSPDGSVLAVGNRNYETRLYEAASGKLLHTLPRRMTHEIAFSPDGRWLAAGYVDGTVVVWDAATGKLRAEAPSGCKEVYALDWSPKGDLLATAGWGGKVVLWDTPALTKAAELDAAASAAAVRFTADGRRLLVATTPGVKDRKLTVWAVPAGGP
jgi:hypothetical protein